MKKDERIYAICKGEAKRFHGIPCEYYEPHSSQCQLLRESPLQVIFEHGRCKPLENIVQKLVIKYSNKFGYQESSENLKRIAVSIAELHIKPQKLAKGHTFPVLQQFIRTIVYRKLIDRLQEEGILPKQQCGECIYLPEAKVLICERVTIIREGDSKEILNPFYHKKRNPSDSACKEGFEPYRFQAREFIEQKHLANTTQTQQFIQSPDDNFSAFQEQVWIEHVIFLLAERAEHAIGEKRKIYTRQFHVFIRMLQFVWGEGKKRNESISLLAKELGCSVKNIKRDIDTIHQFLQKKNVQ